MSRAWLRCSILVLALQVFSPVPSHAQQAGAASATGSIVEDQGIFATSCAACHGLDARGGELGPDIANKKETQQLPDEALLHIIQDGKPGTGMPSFRALGIPQIQAIVRHLRTLQGRAVTEPLPGDPDRGKGLFFGKVGCSECHMANGEGGFIASDLSTYTGPRSADNIRSAITDPDKNLDSRTRPVSVTTLKGRKQTGMVRNEDNFSLQLQAPDGTFHFLAKSELRSIEYQSRSLMPADYGSRVTRQELDDLVSYVMTLGRTSLVRTGNKPQARNDEVPK